MVRLRDLAQRDWIVLALLVAAGAALRVIWQWDRPFENDEGGTILYLRQSYRYLLSHFADPWLSMNVYLCLAKGMSDLTGGARWALALPGFLASLAAIPLMVRLALRFVQVRTALLAAAFMALNPFLVQYGVTIRGYSLLVLGVLGMFAALFDWFAAPRWRHGLEAGAWVLFATAMHPNALHYLLFGGVTFLAWAWSRRTRPWSVLAREALSLAVPVAAALVLAAIVYAPIARSLVEYQAKWSYRIPGPIDYLPQLVEGYFGRGFCAWPSLLLLAAGVWYASQKNHPLLWLCGAVALPMLVLSVTGASNPPWAYTRYLLPVLPILLLCMAAGLAQLGSRRVAAVVALALLLASWTPAVLEAQRKKADYPWMALADELRTVMRPDDKLIALSGGVMHATAALYACYPPERFVRLDGYVANTNSVNPGLIVVTPAGPLVTEAQHGNAGRIHWTLYRAASQDIIARTLLADLVRTVGDRTGPQLASQYEAILTLAPQFGIKDADGVMTDRYLRSRAATLRQRFMPPQFMDPRPE